MRIGEFAHCDKQAASAWASKRAGDAGQRRGVDDVCDDSAALDAKTLLTPWICNPDAACDIDTDSVGPASVR